MYIFYMPTKKYRSASKKRNARGPHTDELNKMEKGEIVHSNKIPTQQVVPFYSVPKSISKRNTSMLPRPEGFDPGELLKNSLVYAESKAYKPTPEEKKELARIPTPDFFDFPPPEERQALARDASAELREANARAEKETKEAEHAEFVKRNKVVPDKKSWFSFARGKKSRKGKKIHKGRRKGKKHSTRKK
jgi:hypothetical protein